MPQVKIGEFVNQTAGFKAFIPYPFLPKEGLILGQAILKKDNQATRLLGKVPAE